MPEAIELSNSALCEGHHTSLRRSEPSRFANMYGSQTYNEECETTSPDELDNLDNDSGGGRVDGA